MNAICIVNVLEDKSLQIRMHPNVEEDPHNLKVLTAAVIDVAISLGLTMEEIVEFTKSYRDSHGAITRSNSPPPVVIQGGQD